LSFAASMLNDATGDAARNLNSQISILVSRYNTLLFGSVLVLHRRLIIHQSLHKILNIATNIEIYNLENLI